MSLICVDVGFVTDGLRPPQSQPNGGPLWTCCVLPCCPVCHPVLPVLSLHAVRHFLYVCVFFKHQTGSFSHSESV